MPLTFRPAQPQITSKKRKASSNDLVFLHNFLRDQFTISTWMSLGALAQLALFSLPIKPYYAAAPFVGYVLWTFADNVLMLLGLKKDAYQAEVIKGRTTALFPDEEGRFKKAGATGEKVAVFHLGLKSYHPLGPFAPGAQTISTYGQQMFNELSKQAEEYGFLGMDFYTEASASTTGSQMLTLMYFKSLADVHRYAESPLHRKAWDWYNRFARQHSHLGIMHELYEVDAGKWENVYVNMSPNGFGVTRHRVYDENGAAKWASPLVDANKGHLSTTRGRLGFE